MPCAASGEGSGSLVVKLRKPGLPGGEDAEALVGELGELAAQPFGIVVKLPALLVGVDEEGHRGQVERGQMRGVGAGRGDGEIEAAELKLFDRLGVVGELAGREDADFVAAFGVFGDLLGEKLRRGLARAARDCRCG